LWRWHDHRPDSAKSPLRFGIDTPGEGEIFSRP
jgi:hypothetical protein